MADYIVRDFPHFTVSVLLSTLRRRDRANARECAHAVVLSTFNHLFIHDYKHPDVGSGLAMSRLLLILRETRHD